jgi:uncharacterized membrane protein YraQ (UPF0718 family)
VWLLGIVFSGFIAAWVYLDARDVGLPARRSLGWAVLNFFVPVIALFVYVFIEHGRVPTLPKPSMETKAGLFVILIPAAVVFFINDSIQNSGLRLDPALVILHGLVIAVLPFLVAGVLISAILDRFLRPMEPGRSSWRAAVAIVVGSMVVPLCCFGLIPVARRLLLKGMPRAVVFGSLFLGSIVNPIVAWNLYLALGRDLQTTVTVMGAGVLGAILTGLLVSLATRDETQPAETGGFESVVGQSVGGLAGFCEAGLLEFCEYGKYLLVGGVYAALLAVLIPKGAVLGVSQSALGAGLPGLLTAFAVPTSPMGLAHFASSYAGVWQGAGAPVAFLVFSLTAAPVSLALLFGASKPRVAGLYVGTALVYSLILSAALSGAKLI